MVLLTNPIRLVKTRMQVVCIIVYHVWRVVYLRCLRTSSHGAPFHSLLASSRPKPPPPTPPRF